MQKRRNKLTVSLLEEITITLSFWSENKKFHWSHENIWGWNWRGKGSGRNANLIASCWHWKPMEFHLCQMLLTWWAIIYILIVFNMESTCGLWNDGGLSIAHEFKCVFSERLTEKNWTGHPILFNERWSWSLICW